MRNKEYIEVASGNATHLKVEVYYTKGGMNYFTGTNESRGIYLSVSPVNRNVTESGLVSESFTAFSGIKKHLKDMARFSQKAFDNFVASEEDKKHLIEYVCSKNGITLK